MIAAPKFSPAVILLAAGASSRMGRPKLLLPWNGTTVVDHLIHIWTRLATAQIGVVRAETDTALGAQLDHLGFPAEDRILNSEPSRGMFSSIQCAARWNGWKSGLTHWVIALGDQPHLNYESLRRLIAFAANHPETIIQPGRNGRPRHPVILPVRQFRELGTSQVTTLKEFLRAAKGEVLLMETDDPGFDLDLDFPADIDAAARLQSR